MRRLELLFRLRHCCLGAADIVASRAQIASRIHREDGNIHAGCRGIGRGAGKRGLGVFDGNLIVARVELNDGVARLHDLVLFHIDFHDLAGDTRADLNEVAVDLRVVSILAEGGVPPDAEGDEHRHHGRGHKNAPAAGPRHLDLCLSSRFVGFRCWNWIRHVHFPPKYLL